MGGLGSAFEHHGEGREGPGVNQGGPQEPQETSEIEKNVFFVILEGQIAIFARVFDGRL